jgi:hypothetical protein
MCSVCIPSGIGCHRQDLLALHAAHAAPDGQASDAIVDVEL